MPKEVFIVMMVCAIFFPFAAWGMWDSFLKHRQRLAELEFGNSNKLAQLTSDKTELSDKVEILEDRLAVLERIATDPARRTAEQIENLR